jgi:uncharacterized protein
MFKESPRPVTAELGLLEKRDALYIKLIELPAVDEALTLLDGLPKDLVYHTKAHTEDVIKETILFALADGISEGMIEQQVIAAAWHDIGYLDKKNNNEPVAVEYFERSRAYEELDPDLRDEIVSNITDTTLIFDGEKKPHLHMEHSALGYMMDADVSNFGREDFFDCMEKIAQETNVDLSNSTERAKMYSFVIALLENHEWHTEGARKVREAQKQRNLSFLKSEYVDLVRKAA